MRKEEFKDISILGRVAYGICCLENALIFYKQNIKDWELLLNQLWLLTSATQNSDQWLYKTAEYLPDSVLEFASFEENEKVNKVEYITKTEFDILHSAYKNANQVLIDLCEKIFYIGTTELYAGVRYPSQGTLNFLGEVLEIMQSNRIPLPEIVLFKSFVFDPKTQPGQFGWGLPFDGKKLSKG